MSKRVVSFHYNLTNDSGVQLDSSHGHAPLTFMEGVGQIIPGLEKVIASLNKGDKQNIKVTAAEAYGERDERYVVKVPRGNFPEGNIQVGDEFQSSEDPNAHPFRVIDVNLQEVTLDANHPLAGVDLNFDVEIIDIREATAEELSHGHVHGPGGAH